MSKATVFTLIEGRVIGIFVGTGGENYELGKTLTENYVSFDDAVTLVSRGAARKIENRVDESDFYTEISFDTLNDIQRWEADSIGEFLEKYALENNYFYDAVYSDWFLMIGPRFFSDSRIKMGETERREHAEF